MLLILLRADDPVMIYLWDNDNDEGLGWGCLVVAVTVGGGEKGNKMVKLACELTKWAMIINSKK